MAEKIIVDGYNLIGTCHRDLRAQRSRLIQNLSAYGRSKGFEITVVFDGIREGFNKTTTVIAGVTTIYSGRGESADDVIKELIGRMSTKYIVVSSDRAIASFAWSKNCVPIGSEDFSRKLYRETPSTETVSYEEEDDEDMPEKRRGNPHMPSRKERLIRQTLDKL